jgi:hypothetical protein
MKWRNQHGSADHGVHLSTIEESFPGRDGIEVSRRQFDDDISMVAMAGGARKQSTISSLTGVPSVQEAQCEDAGVSRKDIRRLYVLVCAALVLVLVGIIVAVSLSVTLAKQSNPAPANGTNITAPTLASTENPRPTTPEPVSMPSTTPADATTTSAPEQAPSTVPVPTESPGPTETPLPTVTRSPIFSAFPPTDPPGKNRRVEHRRDGKVHPHLRSRGQSNQ